ncbi:hypothetical protein [Streptomyces sp. NPDC004658]|uniref:hypothetical protein n=1 Tax=Streptomyces sp. NPDC004658 TaxID=3154672 RepID=UPI0033BF0EA5
MGPVQWGDVPTWVASAFAGAAALFAYQTIRSQRQQIGEQQEFIAEQSQFMAEQTRFMDEQRQNLELERSELRAAAEDRRVAQARRVRMVARKEGATTNDQGADMQATHWRVEVRNESDAPVRNVEVRFGTAYNSADVYELWSEPVRFQRLMQLVELVGPGRAVIFMSQRYSAAMVHNNPPKLYFTDQNGTRWVVDARGDLQPTTQQPGNPPSAE